jgi:hypothetical protein
MLSKPPAQQALYIAMSFKLGTAADDPIAEPTVDGWARTGPHRVPQARTPHLYLAVGQLDLASL